MRGTQTIVEGAVGLAVALVLASITGCAGQRATYEKQVTGLQDDLTVLQNANDRLEERVAALELAQTTRSSEGHKDGGDPARPELKVVKLAPEPGAEPEPAAEPEASPDAPATGKSGAKDEPRPLIHGSGESIEAQMPEGPTSLLGLDRCSSDRGAPMRHTRRTVAETLTRGARA